ncbi:MAG: response regulator transcription factor [Oscillospiraceae bacterium]|jgi:two-component system alkaline phosphatase synthesis response regulator PhoP|nr:response regulator transcription factor [Oscillospiraceae bacterium]
MAKIYVVEDDENIREIVLYALQSAGFEGFGFESGVEFFGAMDKALPDLTLLDIMLPGDDGLTILKRLRSSSRTKALPVILLTAKSGEYDKVKGLDLGADDYMTKPFGVMELISRVNAVLRRSLPSGLLTVGGLTIDNARRAVTAHGGPVHLTYKEFELLYYLALNAGLAMSRDKIMEAVWNWDFEGESRTLDMHIRSLRRKLGSAGALIQTVRNVGYRLGEVE